MNQCSTDGDGIACIFRNALLAGLLMATVSLQSTAFANPTASDAANVGSTGDRIVVVHTDDQVGTDGLALAKSCLRQHVAISEQKALDGTQSVLLIMKYDGNGRIVGVHYGIKDVCEFLQKTPSKIS